MINILDKTTIDKIAAGEVIERPSSVVKELLENSIDAQATSVTVEIKDGGTSFIRVTDNGLGISKEDVKKAYMRHATSKIQNVDDLDSIMSLGFRGEALSTIAAVSQTEMLTKTSDSIMGIKYVIHGGEEIEFSEVGVPEGTTIIVRNLFYNTPARKKFLKSPMTEGSYINDLVLRLALSHPDISFKLIINGQPKLSTPGNNDVKDVIYQLFGRDITQGLLKVDYKTQDISVSGYVGKPFICRGNRGLENYFVNNRYIKSSVVNKAIEEAYKTYVMMHKFPFTVLYIELDTVKCDVNVHPTKMEFKYSDERALFEAVVNAVKAALTENELIPKAKDSGIGNWGDRKTDKPTVSKDIPSGIPKPSNKVSGYSANYNILNELKKAEQQNVDSDHIPINVQTKNTNNANESDNINKKESIINEFTADNNANHKQTYNDTRLSAYKTESGKTLSVNENGNYEGVQLTLFNDEFLSKKSRERHRLIGQLFDTYWLIEYDKNLYIMDQHAAHEKVNFEKLMANFATKEILSQQLMPPMIITVTYQERQAILDNFDLFMNVGYDIEEFGGNEFKINAVPANLYGLHGRTMFLDFVSSLIENSGIITNDIFVKKLAGMACKSSIKGNTKMTFQEADALIEQLLSLENPYTCPHGRPTIISMSEAEIEKKFRRIV